jgi:hypothetical protein
MLRKLWNDEAGAILASELVMVATILVIGMTVGLSAVRDSVVTELADVGQAISNIDQSYLYGNVDGHHARSAGSLFHDAKDFCDGSNRGLSSLNNRNSKCVLICSGRIRGESFRLVNNQR